MAEGDRWWALVPRLGLLLVVLACTACAGSIQQMAAQSLFVPQGVPFEHLVETARINGYEIAIVQPERTRFGVYARHRREEESDSNYRIAIACYGTRCAVTPYGPRVEWMTTRGYFRLPDAVRDEVLDLQALLQSSSNAYTFTLSR